MDTDMQKKLQKMGPLITRSDVDQLLNDVNENGLDLSGKNLRGIDLSNFDLDGANLRGADLSEATLTGADLNGSQMNEADLTGAVLNGASLENVDLRRAILSDGALDNVKVNNTKIRGISYSKHNQNETTTGAAPNPRVVMPPILGTFD